MITLTSAVSATSAALAGLQQVMEGAGHSIVALSSGEVPAAATAPSASGASSPPTASAPTGSSVGALLNEHA